MKYQISIDTELYHLVQRSQLLGLASITPTVQIFIWAWYFNLKNSWATYQDLAGTESLKNLETQTQKVSLEYVTHSTLVNTS